MNCVASRWQKKPDTLTHLTADKMVAKSDPRLGFRAALDSTIALVVWLQIELPGAVATLAC
ncbi:ethanolamine utilization cobalamin adenosyltransferase [Citrobacter koseri]|uniref:Ethanolamine utilization cobalamin adenosyltransferase n=1 Tax=Citrobacter koseri TaxID=545 RepID=A0A2X2VSW6_CITKO|nr:ethanolamine utilization cobalamin adenosyltransferase [Citrobacter koseri]